MVASAMVEVNDSEVVEFVMSAVVEVNDSAVVEFVTVVVRFCCPRELVMRLCR